MITTKQIATATQLQSTPNAPDSNNATWFNYNEETDGYWSSSTDWYRTVRYDYFQHLAEINRGRKKGGSYWNDPYLTYQANRDLIDAVAGQLGLLPRQRQEAETWFMHFDLGKWGMRVELIACCLCARIVHEDDTDERRTHPGVPEEKKPIEFVGLADRFPIRERNVQSMYGKIDSHIRQTPRPETPDFDRRGLDENYQHQ